MPAAALIMPRSPDPPGYRQFSCARSMPEALRILYPLGGRSRLCTRVISSRRQPAAGKAHRRTFTTTKKRAERAFRELSPLYISAGELQHLHSRSGCVRCRAPAADVAPSRIVSMYAVREAAISGDETGGARHSKSENRLNWTGPPRSRPFLWGHPRRKSLAAPRKEISVSQ